MGGSLPVKVLLKQLALQGYRVTGRYKPFGVSDLKQIQSEIVKFSGDIPRGAGLEKSQGKLEYCLPRVPQEVHDSTVHTTGNGMEGRDSSSQVQPTRAALRDLKKRPSEEPTGATPARGNTRPGRDTLYIWRLGQRAFVHTCQCNAHDGPALDAPHLMEKSYVRRDLSVRGIESYTVESTLLVKKALVLPKKRFNHYFTREEVSAVRRAFHVDFTPPRPGSILYLSREGERAEAIQRDYRSDIIGTIMSNLGVRVVRTRETSLDQYRELAPEAETVIADHGAAMCNMLFWNTKYIIECFTDDWWTNCFLMLARALGVQRHALVRVNNTTADNIKQRIIQELDAFKTS